MSTAEIVGYGLRVLGVAYVVGGIVVVRRTRAWAALDDTIDALEAALRPADEPAPEPDPGRAHWLVFGGVLTVIAGIALAAGSGAAVWTQAALVAHQVLYLARQNARARRAPGTSAAEDALPTPATMNAAIASAVVLLAVLWAVRAGAFRAGW